MPIAYTSTRAAVVYRKLAWVVDCGWLMRKLREEEAKSVGEQTQLAPARNGLGAAGNVGTNLGQLIARPPTR